MSTSETLERLRDRQQTAEARNRDAYLAFARKTAAGSTLTKRDETDLAALVDQFGGVEAFEKLVGEIQRAGELERVAAGVEEAKAELHAAGERLVEARTEKERAERESRERLNRARAGQLDAHRRHAEASAAASTLDALRRDRPELFGPKPDEAAETAKPARKQPAKAVAADDQAVDAPVEDADGVPVGGF